MNYMNQEIPEVFGDLRKVWLLKCEFRHPAHRSKDKLEVPTQRLLKLVRFVHDVHINPYKPFIRSRTAME